MAENTQKGTRSYNRHPPILNHRDAEKAKPAEKPYQRKVPAAPGAVLRVQPSGSKLWKLIQDGRPRSPGRSPH